MMLRLKRKLSLLLAVLLCVACLPAQSLAEIATDDAEPLSISYRVHTKGSDAWENDEGWQTYAAGQKGQREEVAGDEETQGEVVLLEADAEPEANNESEPATDSTSETELETEPEEAPYLDSLEMKLTGDQTGLSYRSYASNDESSDDEVEEEWLADGAALESEQGFSSVAVRLSEELDEQYDVWYRASTGEYADEDGETLTWLEWVSNGDKLSSADEKPFVAFEAVLVAEGEGAPKDEESTEVDTAPVEENVEEKKDEAKDDATSSKETNKDKVEVAAETAPIVQAEAGTPTVSYKTHVQDYGWQDWVSNGARSGTTGKSKRLEGINIKLSNVDGGIKYQTHVQDYGWQDWVSNGTLAGTTGQSKRLEAIRISLTGDAANKYDVWYRVHCQDYGWMGWVGNGALAGTTGKSKRLEGIEIILVKKGGTVPVANSTGSNYRNSSDTSTFGIHYQTHVQDYGWQQEASDGAMAGTSGQSKRLEAIRIQLTGADGGVQYRTHVQDYGWQGWVSNGALSGTSGQSKRLEGIQISLTGNVSKTYDVWYRVHVQDFGWQDWVKNGELAGTTGQSKRLEGIEILLLKQGSTPPVNKQALNGVDISGWDRGINIKNLDADFVIIKATEGVTGNLANPAYYNPDYKTWANQALAQGKLIGFYHYANGGDPIAEADWFYTAIKDYKGRAIACLDWEGQGNKTFDTGRDVEWCKKFLDRLKSRFGGTPFLYTSKNYTNKYNWSSVARSYPLWGAEYPNYKPIHGYQSSPWQSRYSWGAWGSKPKIFQYTSTGVLSRNGGIKEFDFNLFYGSAGNWRSYQM